MKSQQHRSTSGDSWERRLLRFPPILVRLLARDSLGVPLTTEEIANDSGLDEVQVTTMSWLLSWKNVSIGTYLAFCVGCRLSLHNSNQVKKQETYLRGRKVGGTRIPPSFDFLRTDPKWDTFYRPLMKRYLENTKTGEHRP